MPKIPLNVYSLFRSPMADSFKIKRSYLKMFASDANPQGLNRQHIQRILNPVWRKLARRVLFCSTSQVVFSNSHDISPAMRPLCCAFIPSKQCLGFYWSKGKLPGISSWLWSLITAFHSHLSISESEEKLGPSR